MQKNVDDKHFPGYSVPGSLDKKGGRRFHLLLINRLHLPSSFLSNEPGTGLSLEDGDLCCELLHKRKITFFSIIHSIFKHPIKLLIISRTFSIYQIQDNNNRNNFIFAYKIFPSTRILYVFLYGWKFTL
jgi:hypothetical protein